MIYVIENEAGRIAQRVDTFDDHAEHYEREGHTVLVTERVVDIGACYVSNGDFVTIPEKPSEFHAWDWATHTWNQDRALAEKAVRAKRDTLLRNVVDTINAVRWSAMDEAKRAEWDAYRTALLDVTDQAGFPFDVEWPCVPI